MKLHELKIKGFRRLKDVNLVFGDATFVIGANNAGKSSALRAIGHLLSDKKQLAQDDYYCERDEETGETKVVGTEVCLEATFRDVPAEAESWRGFKGRIFKYEIPEGSGESGYCIHYKKTYVQAKDVCIELKSRQRILKDQFAKCTTVGQLLEAGADADAVLETYGEDASKKISSAAEKCKLDQIDELWDLSEEEVWFQNPGGLAGNVLSKLPNYLLIPADVSSQDTVTKVLKSLLTELFSDVRSNSANYKEAKQHLDALAAELDPSKSETDFGRLMNDLNGTLSRVFPDAALHAVATLGDPDNIAPTFTMEMSSNVRTTIANQGTGMLRSAVFALLRFRQQWIESRQNPGGIRRLLIGFEEPEVYLHPSAANQMRDAIYELSSGGSQIIATTHSPYLIDLSQKPRQVLNRFKYADSFTSNSPLKVSEEYARLVPDERTHVKMLLKIDDYAARAFFTKKVVLVEGDTEEVVIKAAISRLRPEDRYRVACDFELIKGRGKAALIGFVKYLRALSVDVHVIHDNDGGVQNAEKFNVPIEQASGGKENVSVAFECIEDLLGYKAPASDKPFRAHQCTEAWGDNWNDVPIRLRQILSRAFHPVVPEKYVEV